MYIGFSCWLLEPDRNESDRWLLNYALYVAFIDRIHITRFMSDHYSVSNNLHGEAGIGLIWLRVKTVGA